MAPGAKGTPRGHTFCIVLIRRNLKLTPCLKLKCITPLHKVYSIITKWVAIKFTRKPPCELNIFVLQQQLNLGQIFGISKMRFSPEVYYAAVHSKEVVLLLFIRYLLLLPLWNTVIVICFVVRYLSQSSWC